MADIPILWKSSARKEVMDLLRRLWTGGDEATRTTLSDRIAAGPPDSLLERLAEDARTSSRDRRIFDRLTVIERLGQPPLTPILLAEVARLNDAYPHWRAPEGEQADFSSWTEFRVGPDTNVTVEELGAMRTTDLAALLTIAEDKREGLLDIWRDFAAGEPERGLDVLSLVADDASPEALEEVWRYGLWGIRDHAAGEPVRSRTLRALLALPQPVLNQPRLANAAADILDAAAKSRPLPKDDPDFWALFDRTLGAVSADVDNADIPQDSSWVGLAINRSMGTLATAFLGALFGRGLKVGEGVPPDLRGRLDRLISPFEASHRPARVIAASRLSYLYAVDPDWCRSQLIPCFDWRDETEALAAWQGFAWQPRIDAKLWTALKPHFLPMFVPDRLQRLRDSGRNMAAMLMLVGVEFGPAELPRDEVRDAIRAMPEEMRTEAAAWIATYLRQHAEGQAEVPEALTVDEAWSTQISPWLRKVWPPEPEVNGRPVSAQFARAAVAVDTAFGDAVVVLSPLLRRGSSDMALHDLARSDHPQVHPRQTLALLEAIIDPNQIWFDNELREILNAVRGAEPGLADLNAYRTLDETLRANGR